MKSYFLKCTFLLLFGLFLAPSTAFACGLKAKKSCCKTEINSKSNKKCCCDGSKTNKKNKECGGKCGHSNCTTTAIQYSLIFENEFVFKNNEIIFSIKKQSFSDFKTFISAGFVSVWNPPKIA